MEEMCVFPIIFFFSFWFHGHVLYNMPIRVFNIWSYLGENRSLLKYFDKSILSAINVHSSKILELLSPTCISKYNVQSIIATPNNRFFFSVLFLLSFGMPSRFLSISTDKSDYSDSLL